MDIKSIDLHNFYSYKDTKIKFSNPGTYLIYGIDKQSKSRNGVGKSAITEAIKFALFNQLKVSNLNDAIKFGTNKMEVVLVFTIGNIEYKIERSRDRSGISKVVFFIDGEIENKATPKMTNKYIEEILGLNYEQFSHSFLYGQSEFDTLQIFTSTKLIDFLKATLNLERFDRRREVAKCKLREIEEDLNKLMGVQETIRKLPSINKNRKDLLKQVQDRDKKLTKVNTRIKDCDEEIKGVEFQLRNWRKEFTKVETNHDRAERQLQFIDTNKKCPTCKTQLKNSTLEKQLKTSLSELQQRGKDLTQNIKECTGELKAYQEMKEDALRIKEELELGNMKDTTQLDTLTQCEGLDIKAVEKKRKILLEKKAILEDVVRIFNSKGLPLYILNQEITKLELVINEVLNHLTDFKIKLVTQAKLQSTDKLTNMCKIRVVRGINEYAIGNLSTGEERLVNLAFRIGMAKIFLGKCKFDTLILDEVFSSLGIVNREKVVHLVNHLAKKFKKILLISHIDEIRDSFTMTAHKISIEKSQGTSRITI